MAERRVAEISVAVATRDRPQALARLLDALIASDPRPREIVVVDQSAGPRSEDVVRARSEDDVVLHYVREERGGLAVAQNRGFSVAASPVVAVTDDDCVPDPNWLAVIEERMASDATLGALTGPVLPLAASDPALVPVSSRTSRVACSFSDKHAPWVVGSGNNFAVRRESLDAVRGNDERLGPGSPGRGGVDMDLFYRLLRARVHIHYDPGCVVYHEQATRAERLARRAPYGHGVGAGVAIWLREDDPYALWVLARWVALRGRRLVTGLLRRDRTLAHEEALVLAGTARGLLFGLRAGDRRPSSYSPSRSG